MKTNLTRKLKAESLESRLLLAANTMDCEPLPESLATHVSQEAPMVQDAVAGDANMNGRFDELDIVQVLQAGKYLTGEPADWGEGDWNRDGVFDQSDIVASLQAGMYRQGSYLEMGDASQLGGQTATRTPIFWTAHGPAHMVPFKGTLETTAVTVDSNGGFDATITGGGKATHLGRYEWSSTHHVSLMGSPPFTVSDGELTLTAANGDQLFGTYNGTSQSTGPGSLSFTLDITIDRGTGRFEGAEGSLVATGVVDTSDPTNPSTATLTGSLSSVGSN